MPRLMPYLLHTSTSIAEPEYLTVDSVTYSIDGQVLGGMKDGDGFSCWWTPSAFGTFPVTITAIASNGNTTSETIMVEVTNDSETLQGG